MISRLVEQTGCVVGGSAWGHSGTWGYSSATGNVLVIIKALVVLGLLLYVDEVVGSSSGGWAVVASGVRQQYIAVGACGSGQRQRQRLFDDDGGSGYWGDNSGEQEFRVRVSREEWSSWGTSSSDL